MTRLNKTKNHKLHKAISTCWVCKTRLAAGMEQRIDPHGRRYCVVCWQQREMFDKSR